MGKASALAAALAAPLLAAACAQPGADSAGGAAPDLTQVSRSIAGDLAERVAGASRAGDTSGTGDTAGAASALDTDEPVLVSTIVNVNDLRTASPMTRMLTEQIGGALNRHGFDVKEIKLRRNLLVERGGEYLLSRDVKEIAADQDAGAVMTGTYAMNENVLVVNVRLLDAETASVIASASRQIGVSEEMRGLGHQTAGL